MTRLEPSTRALEDWQEYNVVAEASGGRGIPLAYMQLIRLGPILCSEPATYFHFLLQASFDVVIQSFIDLTRPDPKGQSIMQGKDLLADRVGKRGWTEWVWLMDGLLGALSYWRWLSKNGDEDSVWMTDFGFPVSMPALTRFQRRCSNVYTKPDLVMVL